MSTLYVDATALRDRLGISSTRDASVLSGAVEAASRAVDDYCGRRFWVDDDVSARTYRPSSADLCRVAVDDIATTTGLIVKHGTNGTFTTTVAASDYELDPANGIGINGQAGWPYDTIRLINAVFPWWAGRRTVQITAKWGWMEVPAPVAQATALVAADMYHLKDNRFGVVGVNDFGPLRVGENRQATSLLEPYRRAGVIVGIG